MYNNLTEQDLARYCCEKDRFAEEELYIRYAARVYTLCRRYMGNDEDAKDLMQESLLTALERIRQFRYTGEGSLYAWIRKIAINKAINHIRRKRWRVVLTDFQTRDDIPEPTDQEIEAVSQEQLLKWISELPPLRRTVFNMYSIDGYSHKEIASYLGITEKGSAGVLAKARKQLKEIIRKYLRSII